MSICGRGVVDLLPLAGWFDRNVKMWAVWPWDLPPNSWPPWNLRSDSTLCPVKLCVTFRPDVNKNFVCFRVVKLIFGKKLQRPPFFHPFSNLRFHWLAMHAFFCIKPCCWMSSQDSQNASRDKKRQTPCMEAVLPVTIVCCRPSIIIISPNFVVTLPAKLTFCCYSTPYQALYHHPC